MAMAAGLLACGVTPVGNGTTYDSSHTDAAYARIYREGEPGYFTDAK